MRIVRERWRRPRRDAAYNDSVVAPLELKLQCAISDNHLTDMILPKLANEPSCGPRIKEMADEHAKPMDTINKPSCS